MARRGRGGDGATPGHQFDQNHYEDGHEDDQGSEEDI